MRYISLVLLLSFIAGTANSQTDTTKPLPTYTQYPLPQFSILLPDSTTWFTKKDLPKGKKTIVMLFSPDCEHCKHETERIQKNIALFKKVHIVMVTTLPFDKMMEFYKKFDLEKYKGITVGRDPKFFFSNYYKVRYLPFLAIYSKQDKLLKTFEGNPEWEAFQTYLK